MTAPADCITVTHGKLQVAVPRKIFGRKDAEIKENVFETFCEDAMKRYPWLSKDAVGVIVRNAQKEILHEIGEKNKIMESAKKFVEDNYCRKAVEILEELLKTYPDDPDVLFLYGDCLCKVRRIEEGFEAIDKARSLSK